MFRCSSLHLHLEGGEDAPNYFPINIVGLSQTSREILEDGDVLIFLVVLINPNYLRYITVYLRDHIIHLLCGG